jgi:hypothetical protein
MKERDHLGDVDMDGRIILKCILRKEVWGCGLIHLTQDRDLQQACVNTIMTLLFYKR